MRIAVPHNTTKENARAKVEAKVAELEKQYGHYASDMKREWKGDTLEFNVEAKGLKGNGTVEVTDTDVIIDGKLPLIARPFEPRIRAAVEQEAGKIFIA